MDLEQRVANLEKIVEGLQSSYKKLYTRTLLQPGQASEDDFES